MFREVIDNAKRTKLHLVNVDEIGKKVSVYVRDKEAFEQIAAKVFMAHYEYNTHIDEDDSLFAVSNRIYRITKKGYVQIIGRGTFKKGYIPI